jgi:hypothetical protein
MIYLSPTPCLAIITNNMESRSLRSCVAKSRDPRDFCSDCLEKQGKLGYCELVKDITAGSESSKKDRHQSLQS